MKLQTNIFQKIIIIIMGMKFEGIYGYHFLFFIFYFENVWFEVPFQFKLFFLKHNSSTYNGPLCRSRFTLNPKPTLLVLILFCVW
jgi:hypothetical protein